MLYIEVVIDDPNHYLGYHYRKKRHFQLSYVAVATLLFEN